MPLLFLQLGFENLSNPWLHHCIVGFTATIAPNSSNPSEPLLVLAFTLQHALSRFADPGWAEGLVTNKRYRLRLSADKRCYAADSTLSPNRSHTPSEGIHQGVSITEPPTCYASPDVCSERLRLIELGHFWHNQVLFMNYTADELPSVKPSLVLIADDVITSPNTFCYGFDSSSLWSSAFVLHSFISTMTSSDF